MLAADKIGGAVTSTTAGEIPGVGEVACATKATSEAEVARKVIGEVDSPVKVDHVVGLKGAVAGAGAGAGPHRDDGGRLPHLGQPS